MCWFLVTCAVSGYCLVAQVTVGQLLIEIIPQDTNIKALIWLAFVLGQSILMQSGCLNRNCTYFPQIDIAVQLLCYQLFVSQFGLSVQVYPLIMSYCLDDMLVEGRFLFLLASRTIMVLLNAK